MVWKENEPGIWLDDFDGAEKVFYDMSQAFKGIGKEHGSVYCVCKISIQDLTLQKPLETLLRDAWKALRGDLPALGVVAEGSTKKYLAATPELVEKWAKATFYVNTVLPANKIVPNLHLRKLPCLFFLPQSSEVIFHCSHWRIDALGACMVLDRLLDLVSQGTTDPLPRCDLNHQDLPPSLEDAFGSPTISTPAMEEVAELVRRRNFETSYPTAGLPFDGDMTTQPTLSRLQAMELTVEATKVLISACKKQGISVTAAIHAACSEAVFDLSKHNNHDYSTVVSVNVRDHLPAPYNTKAYACATYLTGITHTAQRIDDFTIRSVQLTKAYKNDWEALEYMTALRLIYKDHGEALQAIARSGTRDPVSNVTVSSLGLIEKYLRSGHGSVTVERFRLGSAIMTRQMTLYIWTFRGRLTMSLDSNEAYYSIEAATDLLESMKTCLERELGLILQVEKQI
ncbi:hypothetical protein MMC14_010274 [Varicellaria rhodocarpa]|nr:hypothetical protein [Varicellaria rhodocarpa]